MRSKKASKPSLTAIIVDSRDGSQDRMVPILIAKELHAKGVLGWDLTNGAYCTQENGRCPSVLFAYPRRG